MRAQKTRKWSDHFLVCLLWLWRIKNQNKAFLIPGTDSAILRPLRTEARTGALVTVAARNWKRPEAWGCWRCRLYGIGRKPLRTTCRQSGPTSCRSRIRCKLPCCKTFFEIYTAKKAGYRGRKQHLPGQLFGCLNRSSVGGSICRKDKATGGKIRCVKILEPKRSAILCRFL